MSKHTPGPWHFLESAAFPCVRDSNDEIIADVYGNTETVKATTRLICAAPDLLEALKEALKDSGCDGDLCCHWWHEAARAAISKAECNDREL